MHTSSHSRDDVCKIVLFLKLELQQWQDISFTFKTNGKKYKDLLLISSYKDSLDT